jgi:hypothetical protein
MVQKSILLLMLLLLVTSLGYPGSSSDQLNRHSSLPDDAFRSSIRQIYESLNEPSLNPEAFYIAMLGCRSLTSKGLVLKDSLLTIIDYSRPSTEDRFYVIDLMQHTVVFKSLVAHGRNSGELYANRFSNKVQSHQSALGFYITGSPYKGGQGYSMLLSGVDTGYNDHSRARAIVIHGASYATRDYINLYGRLGRSFGCPALPPDKNIAIINLIRDGSVLFSYYPDKEYLNCSRVLCCLPKEFRTIAFYR